VTRAAVAMAAVAVLAWLAIMYRDARLQAEGVRLAGHITGRADLERADAAFRAAKLLNPDTTPDLARALLSYGAGRAGDGIAGVEVVLRREPENLVAWGVLLTMTRDRDRPAAARAAAARRRLDPLDARAAARRARSAPP
jgi:hypothetical protein